MSICLPLSPGLNHTINNVWLQIISIFIPRKVIGNSEREMGGGVLKVKMFKVKYEAKLEIPGGRGGSNQNTFLGELWILSGTTQ